MKLHTYSLLLTLALPCLFACGKAEAASEAPSKAAAEAQTDPVSPLVGTWTLDVEGTLATFPEEAHQQVAALLADAKAKVTFDEDSTVVGSMTMNFMGEVTTEEFSGTWDLEGADLTTTITQDGEETVKAGKLEGDSLTLLDDFGSMVFKR